MINSRKIAKFLEDHDIKYTMEIKGRNLLIDISIYDMSRSLGIDFYEEGVGYYTTSNQSEFGNTPLLRNHTIFIEKQINILEAVRKLMDDFPYMFVNQDHMGIHLSLNAY